MTNFIWRVVNCITTKDTSTPPLEIITVNWQCLAETDKYAIPYYGETQLPPADPNNFIDYSVLTQEQIIEWVKATLGSEIATIEEQLEQILITTKNKTLITPNLPWNNINYIPII